MSDEEGDGLIDGVYQIVVGISSSSGSEVLECIEQPSGRHVAMKILKDDSPEFKENKKAMKHEADVMKTLDHPLIIKFERFESNRDHTYIVMEHFRASNVRLQIKSNIRSVQVRARKLFESVCQALAYVHSNSWIHRDIKPDNVLMNRVGEVRLVDFSLATKEVTGFQKMLGGGKQSTIQGTRTYIAPETIRKQTPVYQTDIYSLGCMFFEVLTGRTPFQAPSPEELLMRHLRDEPANASEFNSNVTPEMDRLILRMLKKKPADRPASVDDILAELRRIRIFKEDVVETSAAQEEEKKSKSMDALTEIRLDSRADAKLQVMLQANPELARQFAQEKQAKIEKKKKEAARIKDQVKASNDAKAKKDSGAKPAPMPAPAGFAPQPPFGQFPPQPQFGMPQMPGMMPPAAMGAPGMGMPPGMGMSPGMGMPPGVGMPSGFGMPPGGGMPGMGMPPSTGMPPGMGMPPGTGFPPGMGMPPGIGGAPVPGMPGGFPAAGFPSQPTGMPGIPGFPPAGGAVPGGFPTQPTPPFPQIPGLASGIPPQRPAGAPPTPARGAAPAAPPKPAPPHASQPKPIAKPAPAKPPAPPAKPLNPDEMDYMTELPDIN